MDGVLNVRKPSGPTSHDVVDQIRRIFRQKRVGHTGTLDPIADGVLVVCLGKAAKLVQYFEGTEKEYVASMLLGIATDSQDSTGQVVEERDASGITRSDIESAALAFTGEIEQTPPMVSAVKHKGRRLYELARRGEEVERQARRVAVHDLRVTEFRPGAHPEAELLVRCSSGTYIRTLCADIGERLGCGAHLTRLTRTRVGRFEIDKAVGLDELQAAERSKLCELVTSMNDALMDLAPATITASAAQRVAHGNEVPAETYADVGERVRVLSDNGVLVAVGVVGATRGEKTVRPKTVLVNVG